MVDCPTGGGPYPGDCELTSFLRGRSQEGDKIEIPERIAAKARQVRLLLLDVDGVLTDGTITYSDSGEEVKSFNARDGFGLNVLQKSGVEVGVITARSSKALARRLQDLSLNHVYQGVRHKVRAFEEILIDLGLKPFEVAYMGDDWLDLGLLGQVGLAVSVADGTLEARKAAHYVTTLGGGRGAVREVCDLLLRAQGNYQKLLEQYRLRR